MSPTVQYFNSSFPSGTPTLYLLLQWKLDPSKQYKLQLSSDGVTFADVFTFSGLPAYSHTVDPKTGPWPKVVLVS